jgi:class 3 adenylate cyclase
MTAKPRKRLAVLTERKPRGRTAHHRDVLSAYAWVVAVGGMVLGLLCAFAWRSGGGWPLLVQAGFMGGIVAGSLLCLRFLAAQRSHLAFLVFMVPSTVGCTWGTIHANGAVVSVYVLGYGLLAFLAVFLYPGRRIALSVMLWVVVYALAIGLRLTGWVPVHETPVDSLMLVVAPAMELVILVLAGRITIGRLEESHQRLEEINVGLEHTVAECTLELRRALADSERLLLNVLPREIAARLQGGEEAIADSHGAVSILFADIVGFTRMAAAADPIALVGLLNDIFSEFDRLAEEHGLEKIKTIGDAYMVVGGLPQHRPDHAEAVALLALDMRESLVQLSREHDTPLNLRIGIHTGPVVAGVIGRSKFSYDLWGDAVNIASRLESHGEPGRIQISGVTRDHLGPGFVTESRGSIALKGRGQFEAFWLSGFQPDVDADLDVAVSALHGTGSTAG